MRMKRGSLASERARRYFVPSFSSSPITQSVIAGVHFASKQSIMLLTTSSLFFMEKFMKLVSTKTV